MNEMPPINKDMVCKKCGGKKVLIRGQYPDLPSRKVCTKCLTDETQKPTEPEKKET